MRLASPNQQARTLSTDLRSSLPSLPDSWCVEDTLMFFLNMAAPALWQRSR